MMDLRYHTQHFFFVFFAPSHLSSNNECLCLLQSTVISMVDSNTLETIMSNKGNELSMGRFAIPADSPPAFLHHGKSSNHNPAHTHNDGPLSSFQDYYQQAIRSCKKLSPLAVEIRLLPVSVAPSWYDPLDSAHTCARCTIAGVAFDIVMSRRSNQLTDNRKVDNNKRMKSCPIGEEIRLNQNILHNRNKGGNNIGGGNNATKVRHPPTTAESASRWAASKAIREAKLSSASLTPPCHTAAFVERRLLESSVTSFEQYLSNVHRSVLESNLQRLNISIDTSCSANIFDNPLVSSSGNDDNTATLTNGDATSSSSGSNGRGKVPTVSSVKQKGTTREELNFNKQAHIHEQIKVASVLRFMKWHGSLDNCRFYEGDCWWRVLRCGMDDETKQKVVFYYEDKDNKQR
jgi:hypothetical protein